jgi:hypothetical protein
VPAGNVKLADAFPPDTVPDVAGEPTCVAPLNTVNVTVPTLTVPAALVSVAERATIWLLALNVADADDAVVVVFALTVSVCRVSLLLRKFGLPL